MIAGWKNDRKRAAVFIPLRPWTEPFQTKEIDKQQFPARPTAVQPKHKKMQTHIQVSLTDESCRPASQRAINLGVRIRTFLNPLASAGWCNLVAKEVLRCVNMDHLLCQVRK